MRGKGNLKKQNERNEDILGVKRGSRLDPRGRGILIGPRRRLNKRTRRRRKREKGED